MALCKCMQHGEYTGGVEMMHTCMAMILLASEGHNRMTPMTEVLQWKDKGFLGRADKADEEAMFALYANVQLECTELCLVWMRSKLRAYGSGLKKRQGQVTFH